MAVNPVAENLRLRTALSDLVALSTIPAALVGREPAAIAVELTDVLIRSLRVDFAFVRLCDLKGDGAVEVTLGDGWKAFPEWLQHYLAAVGYFSRNEIIPDVGGGGESRCGVVVPIGVNGQGGLVAAACARTDFPSEIDQLLLSVAANHAATAFQNARLIDERRRVEEELRTARNELEGKVAERTAALRRSEAYLAEAQRLSHTGSFALDVATRKQTHSSDEYSRMFGFDPQQPVAPFEDLLQRVHREDQAKCLEAIETVIREKAQFELEFRVNVPGSPLKHILAIAHPVLTASGELAELLGTAMDVTERKRAEEERQAQLWFFESMDRINRAIQGTSDLEQMMGDVLDVVLAIFGCDRAWLIYPCDPEAIPHRVRMERTRAEYIGAFALGVEIPDDPEVNAVFRSVLASSGPVRFDPESGRAVPSTPAQRFSIKSMIAMAVYPKVDKPHMFGLHQCSHARVWTTQEERLLQEIGRRLADALDMLLMFRNLVESERKLEEAQRIAHVGYWDRDVVTDRITWSAETYRIFGLSPQERSIPLAELLERVHPDDRPLMAQAVAAAFQGVAPYDLEYRLVRPNGDARIVHSQGSVRSDESGRPYRMFGTIQDITERKQAEQLLEDLAGRLINAQEAERSRIGRELHDHVSQVLALLTIKIDQLCKDSATTPSMARGLDELRQVASEVAGDVHKLSYRLHSATLEYQGLVPALNKLVDEFSARQGIPIEFVHTSMPAALPSDVALCLFRITEESLTNIAKHSGAQSARIRLNGASDGIHLFVEDDGDGFDETSLTSKAGLGFVSMRERLRTLHGAVRVDSAPSHGTRVDIWIPARSLVASAPEEPIQVRWNEAPRPAANASPPTPRPRP